MKVTVYFGNVRVIVPCGKGDILVRELVDLAITRYKKATGKDPSTWVTIHNLKSSRDEGILYPDDCLNDVADDREQIIAIFEEHTSPLPPHNGGDGTSASSVGTESPDIFNIEVNHSQNTCLHSCNDVEITGDYIPSGITPLQVRRGSEPALNRLSPVSNDPDPTKRWSTAIIMNNGVSNKKAHSTDDEDDDDDDVCGTSEISSANDPSSKLSPVPKLDKNEEDKPFSVFSRGSGRLSILGNNPEMYRWSEAADRQLIKSQESRKEPLGGSGSSPHHINEKEQDSETSSISDDREAVIIMKNETGPLGIHVVPNFDATSGRDAGLVIQGIEPGGRIDRDGRLQVGDRIIEINGQTLLHVSFQNAQEIFKEALKTPQIKLHLARAPPTANPKKPPPPVYPKPSIPSHVPLTVATNTKKEVDDESNLVEGEERAGGLSTKVATVTPTKKLPSTPSLPPNAALASNTRRIGKKITIQLIKGITGLGFSITTRDNPAGGNCPIYIKNILSKGAAVEDGSLKPGDRLLEVNGIEMTGKSQTEAVTILRNTPLGGSVNLVVSRQEIDPSPSPKLPRELPPEKAGDESTFPWKQREVLTFQIPLNDTGSAGLGVSVKGKTATGPNGPTDLGIFAKSIIHGGAASKDGRLKTNDQLVNINGISLLGMTNSQAMETLRLAMTQGDGPVPNAIVLTIARRIPRAESLEKSLNSISNHQRTDSLLSASGESYSSFPDSITSKSEKTLSPSDSERTPIISPEKSNVSPLKFDTSKTKELKYDSQTPPGRNPVIDRLTGQTSSGRFAHRNESYLMASHDSWNSSFLQKSESAASSPQPPPPLHSSSSKNNVAYSPTVHMPANEMVMIEDEYSEISVQNKVHSRSTAPENSLAHVSRARKDSESKEPLHLGTKEISSVPSQLSLDDENAGFSRDGFGRQSMSEKRHAQLDARNTDTYQRNKKAREERERQKQGSEDEQQDAKQNFQPRENEPTSKVLRNNEFSSNSKENEKVGPSLGMRKSSSLESLQTMLQELQKEEEEAAMKRNPRPATRASRGRGCNESFRAAVDRSYDAPASDTMETLEEESESGSSISHAISSRTTLSSNAIIPATLQLPSNVESAHDDMLHPYMKEPKANKKRGGILKGLGSVFKFGKNRKMSHDLANRINQEESDQESEKLRAHQAARQEQERIQEFYRKHLEQQRKLQPSTSASHMASQMFPPSEYSGNRQERMQHLREQHQRQHQERKGHYPLEEKEEWYEREIKETESRKPQKALPPPPVPPPHPLCYNNIYSHQRRSLPKIFVPYDAQPPLFKRAQSLSSRHRQRQDPSHIRSHSFDMFKEMEKERSGRKMVADPSRYSHYVNYKEIQQHIQQIQLNDKWEQAHQLPKVNTRNVPTQSARHRDRPISNYYEYESIQPLSLPIHRALDTDTSSLPRRNHLTEQPKVLSQSQYKKISHHLQSNGYNSIASHHHHGSARYPSSNALFSHIVPGSKV